MRHICTRLTFVPAGARKTQPAPSSEPTVALVAEEVAVVPLAGEQAGTVANFAGSGATRPLALNVSNVHARLTPPAPGALHASTS